MFGTVQEMNPSKSGKSQRLKINGKWLIANFKVNLDGVVPGASVEYEEGSFVGNDGTPVATVAKIRPAQQSAYPPNQNGGGQNAANSPVTIPKSAPVDEASLRFISNVVGSALTAGIIKAPTEVGSWAIAALRALKSLEVAQELKAVLDEKHEFDDSDRLNEDMPEDFYKGLPPAAIQPKNW